MWEALEEGSCPELKELELERTHLDSDGGAALASALASGSLSKLQRVNMRRSRWNDDPTTVANVLTAMASSCHDLRHLNISRLCDEYKETDTALLAALRDGQWPKLETLQILRYEADEGLLYELASVLEEGGGVNLKDLDIDCASVESMRSRLGCVLHAGACPKLKSLNVTVPDEFGFKERREDKQEVEEMKRCLDDLNFSLRKRGINVSRI